MFVVIELHVVAHIRKTSMKISAAERLASYQGMPNDWVINLNNKHGPRNTRW